MKAKCDNADTINLNCDTTTCEVPLSKAPERQVVLKLQPKLKTDMEPEQTLNGVCRYNLIHFWDVSAQGEKRERKSQRKHERENGRTNGAEGREVNKDRKGIDASQQSRCQGSEFFACPPPPHGPPPTPSTPLLQK